MDWLTLIAAALSVTLLAFANGEGLLSLARKMMERFRGGDESGDDKQADEGDVATYHVHLSWLQSIATHCEAVKDPEGQALAGRLALHLTERQFDAVEVAE